MRKNPISNIALLFGPGRTFGKSNIAEVPPVVVPQPQSPRAAGPGNVHDPFGALAPRKPGYETPLGVQILAQGDHILFARVLFDLNNTIKQLNVPFDLKSARIYGVAGGAHLFTTPSPKTDLDQFGVPLDPAFVGTGLPSNDTVIPIPSIGAREITLISAYAPPPAFTTSQQNDGALHLYPLDDAADSGIVRDLSLTNPQDGTPASAGITYQQATLISQVLSEYSMQFDGINGLADMPFYEINNGGSFSIEALCYVMGQNQLSGNQSVLANDSPYEPGSAQGYNLFGPSNNGGTFEFQFGCTNNGPQTAGNPASISLNAAYHVVATLDTVNQVAYLYVNAVAGTKVSGFGQYVPGKYISTIATNGRNTKQSFNGRLQNIAVYGYALNQSQVQSHYNALQGTTSQKQIPQELLLWLTDDIWSPSTTQIVLPSAPRIIPSTTAVALKPLTKAIASATAGDTQVSTTPGQLVSVLVTSLAGAPAAMQITDGQAGATIGIIPTSATVGQLFTFNMPAQQGVYVHGNVGNPGVTVCFE